MITIKPHYKYLHIQLEHEEEKNKREEIDKDPLTSFYNDIVHSGNSTKKIYQIVRILGASEHCDQQWTNLIGRRALVNSNQIENFDIGEGTVHLIAEVGVFATLNDE